MLIFVYGANTEGIHGAGAAKEAYEHFGARMGKTGFNGRSYGVITKELRKNVAQITIHDLAAEIDRLYAFVIQRPAPYAYFVFTEFGTGLANFSHQQVMDIMNRYKWPANIYWTKNWLERLC
jgi:hypothetical protein